MYGPALLRMCYVYLKDRALAEDAVQETLIKAYLHYGSFHGDSSEKTWLTRIAVNTCRSTQRRFWWRRVDRRVTPESLPEPACPCDPEDDSVIRAVMDLPEKYRCVVLLYYYQEMKTDEIAGALGVRPSTVSVRLMRAREQLKKQLEGWYFDE
jgi:RNA polymerase sigma-70 factor (ECF subfamily)